MNNDNHPAPLVTIPNSLKLQLERAQNLLAQSEHAEDMGNHSLAVVKAREGMQAIAKIAQYAPELGTLLLAGQMGFRGYQYDSEERVESYRVIERKFLGVEMGQRVVPTTTITRRTIRACFF